VLECRAEQDTLVVFEDVLRSIAVMHVKIKDSDPLETMFRECVRRADGNIIEQAEPHRPIPLRVVAGRTYATEGGVGIPAGNQIDSGNRRAGRPPGGCGRGRPNDRVGIEPCVFRHGSSGFNAVDVRARMRAKQLLARRLWSIDMRHQVAEPRFHEPVFDGRQPSAAFRMVIACVMVEASSMTHVDSLQSGIPVLSKRMSVV
jgi:hypothetical protein